MATASEATQKKLDHLPDALGHEFPQVPPQRIAELVDVLSARLLLAARFDDFVPLLAHRRARERLLQESHARGV